MTSYASLLIAAKSLGIRPDHLGEVLRMLLAPAEIPAGASAFHSLGVVLEEVSTAGHPLQITRQIALISELVAELAEREGELGAALGASWRQLLPAPADLQTHPMHGLGLTTSCAWALLYYPLDGDESRSLRRLAAMLIAATVKTTQSRLSATAYRTFLTGKNAIPLGSWQHAYNACGLAIRKLATLPYNDLLNRLGHLGSVADLISEVDHAIENPGAHLEEELEIMQRIGSFFSLVWGKREVAFRRAKGKRQAIGTIQIRGRVATVTESDEEGLASQIHTLGLSKSASELTKDDLHPLDAVTSGHSVFVLDCESTHGPYYRHLKRAHAQQWYTADSNRITSWHHTSVVPEVFRTLINRLRTAAMGSLSKSERLLNQFLFLAVYLGQERSRIEDAVTSTLDARASASVEILTDILQLRIRCHQPEYACDASDAEKAVSHAIVSTVILQIPNDFRALFVQDAPAGHRCFPADFLKGLDEKLTSYFSQDAALRGMTLARLRMPLREAIFATRPDHATLALITSHMSVAAHGSLHYLTVSSRAIQEVHAKSVEWLGLQVDCDPGFNSVDSYVGALRCPRMDHVKATVVDLQERVIAAGTTSDCHNAYVLYTHFLVSIALALRASTGNRWTSKDLMTGLVIYSDKDDEFGYHRRLMVLAKTALQQLRYFEQHRIRTIQTARALKSAETQLDYFFLLDSNGRPFTYGSREVSTHTRYVLPINSVRRLVQSYMWEHGATGEEFGVVMGHWWRGREPWADASCIAALPYLTDLANRFIEPLLVEIGARPIAPENWS